MQPWMMVRASLRLINQSFFDMQIDYVLAEPEGHAAVRDPATGVLVGTFIERSHCVLMLFIARSV
jgi:hypothetical protein